MEAVPARAAGIVGRSGEVGGGRSGCRRRDQTCHHTRACDEMNHYRCGMKEPRALAGSQMPPGGADLRRLLKIDVESELFPATLLKSAGQQINADKLITTRANGNSGWCGLPWKRELHGRGCKQ